MRVCPVCSAVYPEDAVFCLKDGRSLIDLHAVALRSGQEAVRTGSTRHRPSAPLRGPLRAELPGFELLESDATGLHQSPPDFDPSRRPTTRPGGGNAPATDSPPPWPPGTQLIDGRYRIIERIGQGAMGAVYQVEQIHLGRTMALKVLHDKLLQDRKLVARFMREARAMSLLSSQHTVRVYDCGQVDGVLYLAMELLQGDPLDQVLKRVGRMQWRRVVRILVQVGTSLAEAHACGVIHRDLKPANIMLLRGGLTPDFAKVLDFGLAKITGLDESGALESRDDLMGTPFFMSPEQILSSEVDHRTDLYSLGAVAWRMLSGEHLFGDRKSTFEILSDHVAKPAPDLGAMVPEAGLPPTLVQIVAGLLEKKPGRRFQSAEAVVEALQFCLDESAVTTLTEAVTGEQARLSAASLLEAAEVEAERDADAVLDITLVQGQAPPDIAGGVESEAGLENALADAAGELSADRAEASGPAGGRRRKGTLGTAAVTTSPERGSRERLDPSTPSDLPVAAMAGERPVEVVARPGVAHTEAYDDVPMLRAQIALARAQRGAEPGALADGVSATPALADPTAATDDRVDTHVVAKGIRQTSPELDGRPTAPHDTRMYAEVPSEEPGSRSRRRSDRLLAPKRRRSRPGAKAGSVKGDGQPTQVAPDAAPSPTTGDPADSGPLSEAAQTPGDATFIDAPSPFAGQPHPATASGAPLRPLFTAPGAAIAARGPNLTDPALELDPTVIAARDEAAGLAVGDLSLEVEPPVSRVFALGPATPLIPDDPTLPTAAAAGLPAIQEEPADALATGERLQDPAVGEDPIADAGDLEAQAGLQGEAPVSRVFALGPAASASAVEPTLPSSVPDTVGSAAWLSAAGPPPLGEEDGAVWEDEDDAAAQAAADLASPESPLPAGMDALEEAEIPSADSWLSAREAASAGGQSASADLGTETSGRLPWRVAAADPIGVTSGADWHDGPEPDPAPPQPGTSKPAARITAPPRRITAPPIGDGTPSAQDQESPVRDPAPPVDPAESSPPRGKRMPSGWATAALARARETGRTNRSAPLRTTGRAPETEADAPWILERSQREEKPTLYWSRMVEGTRQRFGADLDEPDEDRGSEGAEAGTVDPSGARDPQADSASGPRRRASRRRIPTGWASRTASSSSVRAQTPASSPVVAASGEPAHTEADAARPPPIPDQDPTADQELGAATPRPEAGPSAAPDEAETGPAASSEAVAAHAPFGDGADQDPVGVEIWPPMGQPVAGWPAGDEGLSAPPVTVLETSSPSLQVDDLLEQALLQAEASAPGFDVEGWQVVTWPGPTEEQAPPAAPADGPAADPGERRDLDRGGEAAATPDQGAGAEPASEELTLPERPVPWVLGGADDAAPAAESDAAMDDGPGFSDSEFTAPGTAPVEPAEDAAEPDVPAAPFDDPLPTAHRDGAQAGAKPPGGATEAQTSEEADVGPAPDKRPITMEVAPAQAAGAVHEGRFEIRRLIGSGNLGHVYEAHDLQEDQRVALRHLHPWLGRRNRSRVYLDDLMAVCSLLQNPMASGVLYVGDHGGSPFMVSHLHDGRHLADIVAEQGVLELRVVGRIITKLLTALEDAHAVGLVHGDLQMRDLVVLNDTSVAHFLRVIDFGLWALPGQEDRVRMIKPMALSPEQISGRNVDGRTDMYGVGCLIFEMLAGRPPFELDPNLPPKEALEALREKHLKQEPPPLDLFAREELLPGLVDLVFALLAKNPEHRPASVAEVRKLLRLAGRGERIERPPSPTSTHQYLSQADLPADPSNTLSYGTDARQQLRHTVKQARQRRAEAAIRGPAKPPTSQGRREDPDQGGAVVASTTPPATSAVDPKGAVGAGRLSDALRDALEAATAMTTPRPVSSKRKRIRRHSAEVKAATAEDELEDIGIEPIEEEIGIALDMATEVDRSPLRADDRAAARPALPDEDDELW